MAAIFIESDNTKNLKLLTELAQQLGVTVNKLSMPETKHLHADIIARQGKKKSSKTAEPTFSANEAANSFLSLRQRVKKKMTSEQIDNQIRSLREEWQRDI